MLVMAYPANEIVDSVNNFPFCLFDTIVGWFIRNFAFKSQNASWKPPKWNKTHPKSSINELNETERRSDGHRTMNPLNFFVIFGSFNGWKVNSSEECLWVDVFHGNGSIMMVVNFRWLKSNKLVRKCCCGILLLLMIGNTTENRNHQKLVYVLTN